jgi:hypothetical protein
MHTRVRTAAPTQHSCMLSITVICYAVHGLIIIVSVVFCTGSSSTRAANTGHNQQELLAQSAGKCLGKGVTCAACSTARARSLQLCTHECAQPHPPNPHAVSAQLYAMQGFSTSSAPHPHCLLRPPCRYLPGLRHGMHEFMPFSAHNHRMPPSLSPPTPPPQTVAPYAHACKLGIN